MKLTRNIKAISKLLLILLLLTALIIGAILSYLWVIGYYVSLGIRVPEKTSVSITNVTFIPQNTTYFNLTILNPSYSPSDANILQIATSTEDGLLHNVIEAYPQLPHPLPKAEEKTFKCLWNWANYSGEAVKIIAFIEDGSGSTFEAETPLMDLTITDIRFNSTISVTHFNITAQNSPTSTTYVNIILITVTMENMTVQNITEVVPSLPYTLDPNTSITFRCSWNWTNYQGENIIIAVKTLEGYEATSPYNIPTIP